MSFFNSTNTPSFIPRLMDGTLVKWGVQLDHSLIDLNHIKWRPNSAKEIKSVSESILIDPVTHKAFFADSKSKSTYQSIGYPDVEPELLYSEKTVRERYIEISISEQLAAGARDLIAPYLHTPDTDDTKFSINLTLLSETLIFLGKNNIELPVFAKLCVSSQILTRPIVINNIFSRYCEDYEGRIEGMILAITDFDGRDANTAHLLGYANLVHQIQSKMPVIVAAIGGYGEVLLALGASGLSSGLHESEAVYTKQLQEGGGGGGKTLSERIYIPEAMAYINYEEARKVGYRSVSEGCVIDFTEGEPSEQTKNRHYLNSKLETVRGLRGLNREQKIEYVQRKVQAAYIHLNGYIRDYQIYQREIHHPRWLEVLRQASLWSDPETDNAELEALLNELEREDD